MNTLNFDDVYRAHYTRIFGCCYAILCSKEDAEDITQITFLRAWQHWQEPTTDKIVYWLLGIARHSTLDFIKSKKAKNRTCERLPLNYDPPRDAWDMVDALIDVNASLRALTIRQRAALCIALHYGEGWRPAASRLGIEKGYYELLQRARSALPAPTS